MSKPFTKHAIRKYFRGLRVASAAIIEEKRRKTPAQKLLQLGTLMELVRGLPVRRNQADGRANWRRLQILYVKG